MQMIIILIEYFKLKNVLNKGQIVLKIHMFLIIFVMKTVALMLQKKVVTKIVFVIQNMVIGTNMKIMKAKEIIINVD